MIRLAAPGNKALSVLHVVDPSQPWFTDVKGDESTTGKTMCGIPMRIADSWQLLEQMPGERICSSCTGDVPDEIQETLL